MSNQERKHRCRIILTSSLDQMFTDAFHPDYQLLTADPKRHTYLACALMVRGADIEMSDIRRNIER